MSIHENIKKARKEQGMSQVELAAILDVHQKDVSRWENGDRTPGLEMFAQICKALKKSADELLELNK